VGTADGKRLYVADPGDNKTYVYRIGEDGLLDQRRLAAPQGSDGMTLDEHENLYLTSGAVQVYNRNREKTAVAPTPEPPSNVCFGGQDRRTLFITARTGLYSIRMAVRGQ
jgi:gluconolactonase